MSAPSLRVWATEAGTAVGMYPGWKGKDWRGRVRGVLAGRLPDGHQFFEVRSHTTGSRLEPAGREAPEGEVFVGSGFREARLSMIWPSRRGCSRR